VSARGLLTRYTAWMLILTVANFVLPAEHPFIWTAIGLSSVAAIVYGTIHYAPRRRAPWFLLALAVLCLIAGDLSADLLVRVFNQPDPFPSIADVFYLVMYLLIALGMMWLYRLGTVRRDAAGVLDGLTLTTGVALLTWVYLIGPYVANPDLTGPQKIISIDYPLGDIAILATGATLVASMQGNPALRLLAVGGIGLLASDIGYLLIQLHGTWQVGTPVDLGWVVFYVSWGAAALHPSMRELTEPKVMLRRKERQRRLVLLGLACLIAPAVLLVEAVTDQVRDGAVIAIGAATLSVLVLVRLARAVGIQRRAVERERGLREAGASLLLATDVPGVSTVVTEAVARLLPPGQAHRVLLTAAHDDAPGMAMLYTRTLDPEIAERLDGFEVALRSPLSGSGQPGHLGALYISTDELALVDLQDAAQVLATQAALAIERIRLSAEIDRRNSEEYFRTLVLNTADVILIVDDEERVRYASPSASTLFLSTELTDRPLPDLVEADSVAEVRWRLTRVRAGQPDHNGRDWRVRQPDGGMAQVEVSCRDLRAEPSVAGLVVTLRDVTESRRMQDELYRQATLDALTGLPNREVFVGGAQRVIDGGSGRGAIAAVIVAELDDFKMVNNTMGHGAGDELLVVVGQRLNDAVRAEHSRRAGRAARAGDGRLGQPEWLVARLGGDEFAAFIDADSQADVDRLVDMIMHCFNQSFALSRGEVTVGASIGVATTLDQADAQELLRQADLAVYVAKDAGKGRSLRYEASLHSAVVDRLRLRADLEQAVADGAFVLDYQPIVALATGHTAGFEALVRWQHPVRGLLSPLEFIELAEESGLIVPLGEWVLRHAVRAAARWHELRPGDSPHVNVNVSARQFRSPGFVELVRAELAESRLPPASLTLEITESMLVRESGAGEALNTLRADGVKVAIDDFGTGFSSLSYLRSLPVDVLKLDKSFVDTITSSREQHAIITAITQLARALGLEVVAEGIETVEELDVLVAMGCGFGQGYLLSRPMSYGDAVRWLREDAPAPVGTGRTSS
jgi:PAS domain S-box-containing protein